MNIKNKMKIISWNINGLRAQKSNLKTLLDDLDANIICFQETKITRDQLEETLAIVDGYFSFFSYSRKRSGYSGVATFCKKETTPSFAQEGLGGSTKVGFLGGESLDSQKLSETWDDKDLKELDAEGRCIITQHPFRDESGERKTLSVINVYCPRADPERPERAAFKMSFYGLLRQKASLLKKAGSHVVILGDVNTSHRRIDHCDPDEHPDFDEREDRLFLDDFFLDTSEKEAKNGCTPVTEEKSEAEDEEHFHSGFKVVDTFRHFHPERKGAFTCWNTMVSARATNYGTRIDYVLCDPDFLHYVHDSEVHQDVQGSDHCPVSITLSNIEILSSDSVPPMCTKFYPEFHGNQQKLSSYFKARNEEGSNGRPRLNAGMESSNLLKRKSDTSKSVPSKKKSATSGKQSNLNSFFVKRDSSQNSSNGDSESRSSLKIDAHLSPPQSQEYSNSETELNQRLRKDSQNSTPETSLNSSSISTSAASSNSSWGFLMKRPPPPPLCPGHKEPSVMRTVKKKGPNFNKQFYSCARGVGKDGDPNSRCNFFKWVNNKQK